MLTPPVLAQRRRVLFTMLTTLGFRYPPGREPPVIAGIRQYLAGWPGVGRSHDPPAPSPSAAGPRSR